MYCRNGKNDKSQRKSPRQSEIAKHLIERHKAQDSKRIKYARAIEYAIAHD